MRGATLAIFFACMAVAGCATPAENREMQRPPMPQNQAVGWTPDDRLFRSVTIDYITGMSRRSYWFAEANQTSFRPLLLRALERADLLAPTPIAARYALQIEFTELEGSNIGGDFNSHSLATYRIVHRATGGVVYEQTVPASFTAEFPMLDERDAEKAWLRSAGPFTAVAHWGAAGVVEEAGMVEYLANHKGARERLGIGSVIEASQPQWDTYWRRYYQAGVWTALWGPVTTGLEFINPHNFIALPNFWGVQPTEPVLGARLGSLSAGGIGARKGAERARQADYHMMAQSITRFIIDMADDQDVRFTTIVPCMQSRDVENLRAQLSAAGIPWRTDNCMAYPRGLRGGLTYAGGR